MARHLKFRAGLDQILTKSIPLFQPGKHPCTSNDPFEHQNRHCEPGQSWRGIVGKKITLPWPCIVFR
jgi:hypothetical protein